MATISPSIPSARLELAQHLLREMERIRLVEETIADRYPQQQMRCPVHLSIGQEAPAAGVCSALRADDQAMSGHRSHAHYLAKGGNLEAMIAEMHGRVTGCCGGRGGSMHLIDRAAGFVGAVPIVGSTIPIATGLAFADKLRGRDRVTIAFFGDAATEEGVFHESINFAQLHRLPIVYVCENNLYSVYSPMRVRQSDTRAIHQIAAGHGLLTRHGDGNDVLAVHDLTSAAAAHARSGAGPVFLELATYRWREHCGPGWDNHIGYRSEDEYEAWRVLDPIAALQRRLTEAGAFDPHAHAHAIQSIQTEIDRAFAAAEAAPYPVSGSMEQHVYAAA